MIAIEASNLTKTFKRTVRGQGTKGALADFFNRRYEEKVAVDGVSFQIPEGEIVGFLGPNGAGKSTTIKMLVGILVPTEGHVQIQGLFPHKNRKQIAPNIGVVFGQRSQLWWDIPVSETFRLIKYMYKIPEERFKRNMELFTDVLGIQEFLHVAVRQLSLGQRMRADLCAALLYDPSIVFLDEPTIGLDVVVKKKIREFLLEVNALNRTTILLTTHDMSDVEKLCSRIIIINGGQKVFDDGLDRLKAEFGTGESMNVRVESVPNHLNGLTILGAHDHSVDPETGTITVRYDKRTVKPASLLGWLMEQTTVIDFEVKPSEVEDIIRDIYSSSKSPLQEAL